MDAVIYLIAGPLFLISFSAYLYLAHKLKAGYDSDLDEYYHEFEDHHPGLARYNRWSKICFTVAAISALLLFVAAFI